MSRLLNSRDAGCSTDGSRHGTLNNAERKTVMQQEKQQESPEDAVRVPPRLRLHRRQGPALWLGPALWILGLGFGGLGSIDFHRSHPLGNGAVPPPFPVTLGLPSSRAEDQTTDSTADNATDNANHPSDTTETDTTETDTPAPPPDSGTAPLSPPLSPLDLSDLPEPDLPTRPAAPAVLPAPIDPTTAAGSPSRPSRPSAAAPHLAIPGTPQHTTGAPAPPPPQFPASAPRSTPANRTGDSLLVLSERSSGCEATIQLGGDIPAGLCGYAPGSGVPGDQGRHRAPAGIAVDGLGHYRGRSQRGADYYGRSTPPPTLGTLGDRRFRFPFARPTPITSAFGWRLHPLFGDWRLHTGTDFGAPWGTPVYAVQSGQVTISDFLGGYGLTVVTQGESGDQEVLYGHLSEIFVQVGQWVEQGQPIGRVGSTGTSTGPHLHLELRQWGAEGWVAWDAAPYLQDSNSHDGTRSGPSDAGLPLPGLDPLAEEIDWELQTLGAGFVDGPTPLETMVNWLLTHLLRMQQTQDPTLAQAPALAPDLAPD
ncbi:MAG: peptidoglycan DD-metalloendopeptidase family protein [Prochlorothrix sp.]